MIDQKKFKSCLTGVAFLKTVIDLYPNDFQWRDKPYEFVADIPAIDLLSGDKPPRPFLADGVRYAYQGHRELTAYVLHAASARRCLELSEQMTWQIDTHICNV